MEGLAFEAAGRLRAFLCGLGDAAAQGGAFADGAGERPLVRLLSADLLVDRGSEKGYTFKQRM